MNLHLAYSSVECLKNMGSVDEIRIEEILQKIDETQNFNGLSLSANFASYPPFCSIDEMGNPTGLMYDILKIVARELNLTLKIIETQPRNKDIWLKK